MQNVSEKLKVKNVNGLPDNEIDVELLIPETLEEAIQDVGGEKQLVDAYADHKRNRALTAGRNAYRNAPAGTVIDDLISKVKKAVAEFTLTGGRGIGVKAKAEKLDELKAALESGKEFSRDELLAMLAGR